MSDIKMISLFISDGESSKPSASLTFASRVLMSFLSRFLSAALLSSCLQTTLLKHLTTCHRVEGALPGNRKPAELYQEAE
jgi:hypothetical protein